MFNSWVQVHETTTRIVSIACVSDLHDRRIELISAHLLCFDLNGNLFYLYFDPSQKRKLCCTCDCSESRWLCMLLPLQPVTVISRGDNDAVCDIGWELGVRVLS